jgi:outer membrane protein W
MKRFFLFNVFFFLFFFNAQSQTFPKGKTSFSVGYGAVSYENIALRIIANQLNYKPNHTGPMYFKGEYAVADNFTVGMNVNYSRISATFNVDSLKYSGNLKLASTSFILRANYTLSVASDNGGIYFGAGLGYRAARLSYTDDNPNTPLDGGINIPLPITFEGTLGYKYFFTPNVGVYAEIGITRSLFQAGITTRF